MSDIPLLSLGVTIRVEKPSGAPLAGVEVRAIWDFANPYDDIPDEHRVETDEAGLATIPIADPKDWGRKESCDATVTVFKRHHGPVVFGNAEFKNGEARVRIRHFLQRAVPVEVLNSPETQAEQVKWGRLTYVHEEGLVVPASEGTQERKISSVLHIVLVKGGTLGVDHSQPLPPPPAGVKVGYHYHAAPVLTRRLSSENFPSAVRNKLSQVDEELIYHIAHGDLALTEDTDFIFEHHHAPDEPHDAPCNERCRAVPAGYELSAGAENEPSEEFVQLKPGQGAGGNALDQAAGPFAPKVAVRNSTFGGLRAVLIGDVSGPVSSTRWPMGMVSMKELNPRNVVGVVRLAKQLSQQGVRLLLTVGFERSGGKDAHGRGRAIDVSGVSLRHPPSFEAGSKRAETDPHRIVRSQNVDLLESRDFLVILHWGNPDLKFEDPNGVQHVTRAADITAVGRNTQYRNDYDPGTQSRPQLLYRLEPAPVRSHQGVWKHSTDHYTLAGRFFRLVTEFLMREYSCRDRSLGPITELPPDDRRQAEEDDLAPVPAIGSVQGFVIHPDYPKPNQAGSTDGRQRHFDHIHGNLGHNGPAKSGASAGQYSPANPQGYER